MVGGGRKLSRPQGRDAIRAWVAAEPLLAKPGMRACYSDLGFVLLDWLIERQSGLPADQLFELVLAEPLGLRDLFFIDLKDPGRASAARAGHCFAATELCPWRKRVLCAEVHDDNTFAMGGVSGQAGLFGSAEACSRLAQVWLEALRGQGNFLDPVLAKVFCQRSDLAGSTRALGFDTPSPGTSSAGRHFGPRAIGHTGFTGTSLWLDPDRQLSVCLLTNRVHPSRNHNAIGSFRPRLHDLVMEVFAS